MADQQPPGLTRRSSALALSARFTDELGSGVFGVLSPTLLRVFGLDLVGLALLNQVLFWVALVVEPIVSLLIDIRSRRGLLVWGSGFVAFALLLMGGATGYALLLVGFAAYGVGSGPLAHTADVVLIEAGGADADRLFARATFFDGRSKQFPVALAPSRPSPRLRRSCRCRSWSAS
ncbi:MAG: hypothetical protein ACR2H3_14155 [Acidimicrobiales bacterium]